MKNAYNKIFYIGFVSFGLYEAIFKKDYMQAASFLGIALVFDPFNVDQKWSDRPIWKKAILIIHLGIVAALFVFSVGSND